MESAGGEDTSGLENFLGDVYELFPPTPVPASIFISGASYVITATLCNFLGKCSADEGYVSVTSTVAPSVSIFGLPTREISRSSPLRLYSEAFSPGGGVLYFQWQVQEKGIDLSKQTGWEWQVNETLTQASISTNPAVFHILENTLQIGVFYKIILSVTDAATEISSTAECAVSLSQGQIVARVLGGVEQTVSFGNTITLDASSSYDEDNALDSSGLSFQWQFSQISPSFQITCPLTVISNGGYDDATITIAPIDYDVICSAVVSVYDSSRSTYAEIFLKLISSSFAEVSVYWDAALTQRTESVFLINPDKKLKLYGVVQFESSLQVL